MTKQPLLYVQGIRVKLVKEITSGEVGALILDRTPFYAESGGQVGDAGIIRLPDGLIFRITDTQKSGDATLHFGECVPGTSKDGAVTVGMEVWTEVNVSLRSATVLNHSATHLLHAALRQQLGKHVSQKGSQVGPDKLRFDFSHYEGLTPAQLSDIEQLVNEQIRCNAEVKTRVMSYDAAVDSGAVALFGEKYGDEVRVLHIGDFSTELCGGTHVRRAGDIGLFKIVAETGIASVFGVSRRSLVSRHWCERPTPSSCWCAWVV